MISLFLRVSAIVCGVLFLSNCTGYQLGATKPVQLVGIDSLYVPLMQNDSLFVRAEAVGTNTLVDALTRDGSYQIATVDRADAVLRTTLKAITYDQVRSSRLDSLRSEEIDMTVRVRWTILGPNNTIIDSGIAEGESRIFVADNLQTARRNALPDAMRDMSEKLVARLAHGF